MLTTIVALVVLGTAGLVLEVFLPGGVLGVLGGIAILVAIGLVFTADALAPIGIGGRMLAAAGIMGGTAAAFLTAMRFFPRTPMGKRLTLGAVVDDDAHYHDLAGLVGKTGTATCELRPAGKAVIEGQKVDVSAVAGIIESGAPVVVVRADGNTLYVDRPKAGGA